MLTDRGRYCLVAREALTREAARRALALTASGNAYTPLGRMLDERAFANGIVG